MNTYSNNDDIRVWNKSDFAMVFETMFLPYAFERQKY